MNVITRQASGSSGEIVTSSKSSKTSNTFGKRIPRTTAKKRGLIIRTISDEATEPSNQLTEDDNVDQENEDEEEMDEDDVGPVVDNFDSWEGPVWENDNEAEDYFAKLYKNGELYNDEEFGKIVIKPWQLFTNKQHLRDVVRDYCIQSGFSVVVLKASNLRWTVKCSASNNEWRLHASRLLDGVTWTIKSIQNMEHTCSGLEVKNPMVSTKWAARVLLEDIRANNDIPAKSLNQLLWQRYGVQMSTSTLYRMRLKALRDINGGREILYAQLPDYCEMVRSTNPGSSAFCAWTPQDHIDRPLQFLSIFISFKGCIDGLLAGCRSFIGVDRAHLKGNYGGVLLSAVALDANNELFPFAWAIVSVEDTDNRKFFMWHLKNLLKDSEKGDEWCIILDRQKAGRRYCCKHLVKNGKKPFPGPLMFSLFWRACGAYSEFTFKKAMEQLHKVNPAALIWLSKAGDQSAWTKHKFNEAIKCDVNKSNFVESFNATLGMERARPVLTLLEGIRRTTMVWMCTRKQASANWIDDDICPSIKARLKVITQESKCCKAYPNADGYEVTDGKSVLLVSFAEKRHGMRAILHARLDPKQFVHEWYSMRRYKGVYAGGINSIPDSDQWLDFDMPKIEPPVMKRGVGRPCRERRRDEDEERKGKRSKTIKCSNCQCYGHNSATCKGGPTAKQVAAASASTKGKGKQADVASAAAKDKGTAALASAKAKGKEPMSYSQPAPKMRKLSGIRFSTQP
ncbi:uncharacterized protein LOC110696431 [Chenopodium quinoa]|uniref:uncharacterized protein LOC110696431 n=1 Tax=Chenopodium quinoa TaxID=63459 RepID=UPI000B78F1AD|nr:uncharacterized protein LOC110696431 [Chenopodium quinoa]